MKNRVSKRLFIQLAVFTLILFIVFMEPLCAQTYVVTETLDVSYDGTVHVKVEIVITELGVFTINITLHEAPEGLLVYDENGMPLNYEISENKISIFVVNNTKAYVEYLTRALTKKEGPIWTISLTFNDGSVNILFPKGTSILDIIGTPKAIKEVEGKKLLIAFEPGEISVDYALPLLTATPSPTPSASPSPTPTSSPTPTAAPTTMPVPYEYLLWAIIIGVVVIIAVAILKFRR